MSEISLKEFEASLKGKSPPAFYPVCLFYGEEMLYKRALDALLQVMLPDEAARSMNYEAYDGANENIFRVIEQMNTFSFMGGPKAVALLDSAVFQSGKDDARLLEKSKQAHDKDDFKKAAAFLAQLLALRNITFRDLKQQDVRNGLAVESDLLEDVRWVEALIDFAIENNVTASEKQDAAKALTSAIENGFPEDNYLIISAENVDKRSRLYKVIKEKGLAVDCAVPKGERYADKKAQDAALADAMNAALAAGGKKISKAAYAALYEKTGFDLRTFVGNINKLMDYIGDRKTIEADDVQAALTATKKDPIYELTNAVFGRDAEKALYLLRSLLDDAFHPLQILAMLANQVRKLIAVRGFMESPRGGDWCAGLSYNAFRERLMPKLQAFDQRLAVEMDAWETFDGDDADAAGGGSAKKGSRKKKTSQRSDLMLVKNPNNPYPVYQTFLKAEKFDMQALVRALDDLSRADAALKTSGAPPGMLIEKVILGICRDDVPATRNTVSKG